MYCFFAITGIKYIFRDDDMISLASLMSYDSPGDTNDDVGNMADFDGLEAHTSSFSSFTAQMGAFLGRQLNIYWFMFLCKFLIEEMLNFGNILPINHHTFYVQNFSQKIVYHRIIL